MKIFAKLFLLLTLISALPMAVLGGVAWWRSAALKRELLSTSAQTGDQTTHASLHALFASARAIHLQVVQSKAAELEAFFERGRRIVQLEATLASGFSAEAPSKESAPLYTTSQFARKLKDPAFQKLQGQVPYGVYELAAGPGQKAAREAVARLARLGAYFSSSLESEPALQKVYIARQDSFSLSYPIAKTLPSVKQSSSPANEWYGKAVEKGRVTWSDFYTDAQGKTLITCAAPVYAGKRLIGVAGADFSVDDFIRGLLDVGALPSSEAILVNYIGQIRIAASYGPDHVLRLNSTPPEASPTVDGYVGGGFKPAFAAAQTTPSGTLLVDAQGKPLDTAKFREGDLLAYARVLIRTREGGKYWYYLVRTPIAELIKPIHEVRETLAGLNTKLEAAITKDVRGLVLQIALLVLLVILGASAVAFAAARSVTQPLLHIADVLSAIGRGDLDKRVVLDRKDEIGGVGDAINTMTKGLKEGLFVKQTFKRYVAASVVEHLIANPDKLKLGGDRREMTVFFSDVSGFTSFAEKLPPEVLVELINEYLSEMTDAIFRYEGTIDKYVGDAIVAFWGAPVEQPDHALRACRAALDNLAARETLAKKWTERGLPALDIRIGVNTGPMVVGNMGSQVKLDYTVMGDAVNLGSRLEGVNKFYGTRILISETTRRAAGEAIAVREVDLLAVKGKQQAIKVFELLGLAGSVPEARLAGYRAYESGLEAYRQRRWDDAESGFKSAIAALGDDGASREMLARTAQYRAQAPAQDWDGRFTLSEK